MSEKSPTQPAERLLCEACGYGHCKYGNGRGEKITRRTCAVPKKPTN